MPIVSSAENKKKTLKLCSKIDLKLKLKRRIWSETDVEVLKNAR